MTHAQIRFLLGFFAGCLWAIPFLLLPASAGLRDWINSAAWAAEDAVKNKPLSVPQSLPPVGRGNGTSIAPCAAPPPTMASAPEVQPDVTPTPDPDATPYSLQQFHPPRDDEPAKPAAPSPSKPAAFVPKDLRAKILLNTRPGNRMLSLIGRVGYPSSFNDSTNTNYYETEDGTIAVVSERAGDTVVSISFLGSQNQ